MAVEEQIAHNLNSSIRRLARVQGFATTDSRKLKSSVNVVNRRIKGDFSDFNAETMTVKGFNALRASASEHLKIIVGGRLDSISEDILELGEQETLFNLRLLNSETTGKVKSPNNIDSDIKNTPVDGIPYTDTYKRYMESSNKLYRDTLTSAYYSGLSQKELYSELNRVSDIIKRRGETLVRTLVNHTSNVAKNEVYEANKDVIAELEFRATLDDRTTLTCAKFDGMTFPVGSHHPQPPLHYNCRSVVVPIVKDDLVPSRYTDLTGERASFGSDGRKPVDANLSFKDWFAEQSTEWQKDYLGEERFKLYESGKFTIDKFTDDLGRPLTLEELGVN